MRSLHNQNKTHQFVDSLEVGTRVVWIANGSEGTVQADRSILWDDGYHMTRERMQAGDLLLISNPQNPKRVAILYEEDPHPVTRVRRKAHGADGFSPADAAVRHSASRQDGSLQPLRSHPSGDVPPVAN